LINNDDEVPSCINRFAEIKNGSFLELTHHSEITKGEERTPKELPYFLQKPPKTNAKEMVKLENVNVSYGEKKC
jgi:molybdate transport system ATP-binding protein